MSVVEKKGQISEFCVEKAGKGLDWLKANCEIIFCESIGNLVNFIVPSSLRFGGLNNEMLFYL